jgi:hypothetical protein
MTRAPLTPEHRAAISKGLRKAISDGLTKSPETREKIAAAKRGKPRDQATRSKISATLTGRKDDPETRTKKQERALRGSTSPTWVGESISYNGAHNRARLTLPTYCNLADETCKGPLEVALRHDVPVERTRISPRGHRYFFGENSTDGYQRLCRSHHRRYDNGNR